MTRAPAWSRAALFFAALAIALAASVCDNASDVVVENGSGGPTAPDTGRTLPPDAPPREVADYGPPAPTIYFVASLKGYTEPCGCTVGLQVGGLDRLVGTLQAARALQPASLVVDAGNLLFDRPQLEPRLVEQERRKAPILVAALRQLGAISTTPGPNDLAQGLAFYRETLRDSGMVILAANLQAASGAELAVPSLVHELGGVPIGLIGAVDPPLFQDFHEVVATPAAPAVTAALADLEAQGVTTTLLVLHGDLAATQALVEAVPGIDFAIVGHAPAETEAVLFVGPTAVLQAYDQGRYLGILKLYPAADGLYRDARREDRAALDRIDCRLSYLQNQLLLLPPSLQGEEPEIVLTMRAQIDELEAERMALRHAGLEIPAQGGAFLYWPLALEPGYPRDATVSGLMAEYNRALEAINRERTEIVPLGPGDVRFVGGAACIGCHVPTNEMWLTTPHSHAIETLDLRDKDFDELCVGCHVTGFNRPGGSVTANHNGLANVQCEACHGPGGDHVTTPPGHIVRNPEPSLCEGCHTPENSPVFAYDRYLPLILGPGHGQPP